MSDYEDYDNLAFPPQEERIEQKLEHSEKMRDYTAEYVAKLEEKLKIAKLSLLMMFLILKNCKHSKKKTKDKKNL